MFQGNLDRTVSIVAWIPVIASTLSAILTSILGPLIIRLAQNRRMSELEYRLKRLDLLEHLAQQHSREAEPLLQNELAALANFMRSTAPTEQPSIIEQPRPKVSIRTALLPPRPTSVGGWVAAIIYYIYALSTVSYLVLPFGDQLIKWNDALPIALLSFLAALVARQFVSRPAHRPSQRSNK